MFEQINKKEEKESMIELPDSFECVFKEDPESLVPKIESLIGDLSIRIKPGFGYSIEEEELKLSEEERVELSEEKIRFLKKEMKSSEGEAESFKGLIVEFEQLVKDRKKQEEKSSIDIGGTVDGVLNFFEGLKTEMEKLGDKEKIKLEKNLILAFKNIASANIRGIDLRLPVLARTEKGDISAMSYRDIEKMISHVKEYEK